LTSPSEPTAAGFTVHASYFDAVQSRAHPVILSIRDDRVLISGEGILRDEPLGSVSISERIGRTPRFVRFTDGALCEVTDHATFRQLLSAEGLDTQRLAGWEDSRWMALWAVLLLVVLGFAGYRYGLPFMAQSAADRLPPSALNKLSGQILSALDRLVLEPTALPASERAEITVAFSRLRLPPSTRIRLEFRRSPAIGANAFALPSGVVVVTDELVALAGSSERVVAVLAHEAGHVVGRHGLRNMIQSSVVSILVTWYVGDISALAAAAPTALLEARYSRDLEREADQFAARVLTASGSSASVLADMLEQLRDARPDGLDRSFAYLSSHPTTDERIQALREPRGQTLN
jgi:Zn-dependent protease with chaperone function